MAITRVRVFNSRSRKGYDEAVYHGLERARETVEPDELDVIDNTVINKSDPMESSGQKVYSVGLDVSFGVDTCSLLSTVFTLSST